ncbi:DUF2236 domain-containing protein [Scytonema sp. UIC 10036]|uniref:oxygenase MpaB family protein n=1 Tax=Scytonema sp. UIC 10036 TaxID=2304196 RepID=UPI0012DAD544|nr:oxygenase MpaB family protein [Scytonema sp. UIC 10036]MUG95012.1 DUF2236 domain-containing protein [Scytonema sp. UIC 10036]
MRLHRYDNLHLIQELNPLQDHCQIYHLMLGYEFPWDITRALEVALMKTYCVPSISKLLDKTREFHKRPQKRYDDTAIIIVEFCKWGYGSERGCQAIQRMNAIHSRFKIDNADFLYVLSTFIYEPIRWNARFGWRLMSEQEKLASFYFWREVGNRMHIEGIPTTYEDLEQYNIDYERTHFRYAETNRHVGEATRDLFLSWYPKWMSPLLKPAVYALLDDTMLDAFGFEHPGQWLRRSVETSLQIRSKIQRFLPPLKHSKFFIDSPTRTYPHGYEIANLGSEEKVMN